MFLFDEAAWTLETEINSMFQKYATENGLTNAEASKLLTGSEYSRWKKGIEEYLKEAEGDSKTLLELNTLAMKSRISRKEQMLATVYQTMITLSRDTETKITDLLGDMFKTNYYRGCYDVQSILGVGFNVSKVDVKMLQRILKHPWSGKNYSQALWENTDKLATLAKRELTMGFMNGSSVQKMAKEINDVMGKGRYAAERLVRTESSYFSNQGELASYREMGIQEYGGNIMSNPYSDKRWSDAPKPVNSECNSCKYHYGFGKCEKHPEGIPKEKLKQSFPGTGNYNKKYCEHKSK